MHLQLYVNNNMKLYVLYSIDKEYNIHYHYYNDVAILYVF